VPGWPPITEPELLERLAMDDRGFERFIAELVAAMPVRTYDAAALALAVGYPWERPPGSYLLSAAGVEPLESMSAAERELTVERFTATDGRSPLLAIGSNASPEALERKFAHFPDANDRAVLALTGRLQDFDVGVAPQPTIYGAMPATLFPSPRTAVCATVLWVTPVQFTQLTWSELSYRLGSLQARFETDDGSASFDEVLLFVSRFGAFCIDDKPVALAAIPADGRTADALTQEQLLDAAARLAIGADATAELLVRAIFEEPEPIARKIAATVHRESLPFASELWTPFRATPAGGRSPRSPA
jgi:hypothetical protein